MRKDRPCREYVETRKTETARSYADGTTTVEKRVESTIKKCPLSKKKPEVPKEKMPDPTPKTEAVSAELGTEDQFSVDSPIEIWACGEGVCADPVPLEPFVPCEGTTVCV